MSDDAEPLTGTVADGATTNDTTPTLTGTAEAGSIIAIFDNGTSLGTTTATGGAWSFAPATALAQGGHSFTATATDAAGQSSTASAAYAIVIDTAAPAAPTITAVSDDAEPLTGTVADGATTDDTTPTLTGTGRGGLDHRDLRQRHLARHDNGHRRSVELHAGDGAGAGRA